MIQAKMIVDFDNPVSMKYMELSLKSFKPLSDILEITPVQCTKPETLPIRVKADEDRPSYLRENERTFDRFFGGDFEDNPVYQSIMHSHFKLWKELVESEDRLIIMEHDAALINEYIIRKHLENFMLFDIFMPGACMEFYSMSPRWAKMLIDHLLNFPKSKRLSGPYGVMWDMSTERKMFFDDERVLIPTKLDAENDRTGYGIPEPERERGGMHSAAKGKGETFPVSVKQYFFMCRKNTSPHRYDMDTYSCMNNTESYPWRRDFVLIDDLEFDDLELPKEFE